MQYQRSIITFMTLISWLVVYAASLFNNGKTDYKIVLFQDASITEKTAAEELRTYLKLVSGAEIPIISSSDAYIKGHHIFIGYHHSLAKKTSMIKPDPEDDGFTYKTSGDNLYIYGGKQRGTMFGVYAFLENELGIRWYTKDVTKIPTKAQYVLPSLNHSESPAVKYRFVEFKHFHTDAALYAHNKMNMVWDASPTKYGKLHNYWGIHTSETLVPTKKYFKTHPEFFSYRNGKRVPHSQLCLSNPEVLKVVVSTLKTKINTVINYWGYDVSQNDNHHDINHNDSHCNIYKKCRKKVFKQTHTVNVIDVKLLNDSLADIQVYGFGLSIKWLPNFHTSLSGPLRTNTQDMLPRISNQEVMY